MPTDMGVADLKLAIRVSGKLNKAERITHLSLANKSMRNKLWFCEDNFINCVY